jgi:predicted nucleic acid-binding protein
VRRVVSNTGPLLHLYEAELLALLEHAGAISIPKAVDSEMAQHEPNWRARKPSWITVTTVTAPYNAQATRWQQAGLLDAGEAEAIALARQLNAHWFLTDDAAARVLAASLGLEVHGSLGVVLWAAAMRHLSRVEAEMALDRLAQSSLWLSARVIAESRVALERLFTEQVQ